MLTLFEKDDLQNNNLYRLVILIYKESGHVNIVCRSTRNIPEYRELNIIIKSITVKNCEKLTISPLIVFEQTISEALAINQIKLV